MTHESNFGPEQGDTSKEASSRFRRLMTRGQDALRKLIGRGGVTTPTELPTEPPIDMPPWAVTERPGDVPYGEPANTPPSYAVNQRPGGVAPNSEQQVPPHAVTWRPGDNAHQ